jgi:hypothetical protein
MRPRGSSSPEGSFGLRFRRLSSVLKAGDCEVEDRAEHDAADATRHKSHLVHDVERGEGRCVAGEDDVEFSKGVQAFAWPFEPSHTAHLALVPARAEAGQRGASAELRL